MPLPCPRFDRCRQGAATRNGLATKGIWMITPPRIRYLVAALMTVFAAVFVAAAPAGPSAPAGKDHWSFKAPVRPELPQAKSTSWVRNPIHALIPAEHEKRGLPPRPEAPPHILLRPVYLALTRPPPTRQPLHALRPAPS